MLNDDSGFKRMLELMQQSEHKAASKTAAEVVGVIVSGGNQKYYKMMQELCQHPEPAVRLNVVSALTVPCFKQLPAAMYKMADYLVDPDKAVRLASIDAFSQMPMGCREASTPMVKVLEDEESDVRFAAAEALGVKLLDKPDLELKLKLVEMFIKYDDVAIPLKKGLWIGAAYRSLDVGFVGVKVFLPTVTARWRSRSGRNVLGILEVARRAV